MLLRSYFFHRSFCKRLFHTTLKNNINSNQVEEVKIPVPWGHIAGKWWGNKNNEPIIALHGWQDNAASWDPLAKILSSQYSLLAIDFQGSGFSSFMPDFHNYNFLDSVTVIHRIRKYYNLDKIFLLGHSGGSASAFLYSSIYSEFVKAYFGIDFLVYAYGSHKRRAERLGNLVDKKVELGLRDNKASRFYDWDDAVKLWVQGTKGSVNHTSANILMSRGVSSNKDGKVKFSRDHRLKTDSLESIDVSGAEKLAESIKCHVFLIKGSKSPFFQFGIKNCPHILDIIIKNAKTFEFHTIEDANHHLHMDVPEKVVPLLEGFLSKI